MTVFLLSFVLISLAFAGLAIGVMLGRKPISGSCGGLNQAGVSAGCELCGGEQSRCDELRSDPPDLP